MNDLKVSGVSHLARKMPKDCFSALVQSLSPEASGLSGLRKEGGHILTHREREMKGIKFGRGLAHPKLPLSRRESLPSVPLLVKGKTRVLEQISFLEYHAS
jgi:hypothetical protein